jgi:AsmA protein
MLAEIDDLRRFATWTGVALPDGDSLKTLTLSGGFHLGDGALSFDDGTFTLDGNKADGLLAVTSTPVRPRIEGTLAFDRLVLDPYLGIGQHSVAPQPIAQISPFDRLLLQYFDADLRISAAEIAAGAMKFGHGAFTITAKNGSVTGEIGELELCGGDADGRVGIELAPATKQVRLSANLTDITLPACFTTFGLDVPVSGTGGIKADLASEGNGYPELTRNLSGTVQAKIRSGAVPVDVVRLLATPPPLDANGWNRDGPTAFDQLAADCRLNAGHLWCQSVKLETSRGTFMGAGEVDLPKQTLDWNLVLATPASAAKGVPPAPSEPQVSIRGPLSQPTIRRADRPTLGDGSQPVSAVKPRDLPN